MRTRVSRRFFSAAIVAASVLLAADSMRAQASPQLEIERVTVDDARITISGRNFGGAATVTLGSVAVTIVSQSDVEIVGDRPLLSAGTYALVVSRDGGATAEGTAQSSVLVP